MEADDVHQDVLHNGGSGDRRDNANEEGADCHGHAVRLQDAVQHPSHEYRQEATHGPVGKCTSEMFIDRTMPSRFMVQAGVPAVFPFSLSYHIPVINRLSAERVSMFGCGFVHDSMPIRGVHTDSISMTPMGPGRQSSSMIRATLGKPTYIEPYLSKASIPGLVLV